MSKLTRLHRKKLRTAWSWIWPVLLGIAFGSMFGLVVLMPLLTKRL